MKKFFFKNIIALFIILSVLSSQILLPYKLNASNGLPWNNPNKSTPYTFKVGDILNSRNVMTAIGCTGIVNKVSKMATDYVKTLTMSKAEREKIRQTKDAITKAKASKNATVATAQAGTQAVSPGVLSKDTGLSTIQILDKYSDVAIDFSNIVLGDVDQADIKRQMDQDTFREECLNGLAYSLAKQQLTAMTRSTINWVNTGFNGDPMFIRDMDSFLNSISSEITVQEVDFYKNADSASYPFGKDTARSLVNDYKSKNNFKESVKQNLTNYLEEGASIDDFSKDFSKGGWKGWLALTQKSQNNSLGFSMLTSQNIADKTSQAIQNVKDELTQTGFLSQKKCVKYSESDSQKCEKYEVITPGSLIKDKVSTYLNSPERQLELADTMNEGLNALFTSLLSRFQTQGLSGISTNIEEVFESTGGFGSNSLDVVMNSGIDLELIKEDVPENNTNYSKFDITKDLGDTYGNAVSLGSWNAKENTPEILPNVGVKNTYYTVSTPGNDVGLLRDLGAYWNVGDKVFFDGEKWMKGIPKVIIEKKGIIHVQQDYLDALNGSWMKTPEQAINTLARSKTKMGELDYCIPGPNPKWEQNSQDAKTALQNLLGGLTHNNLRLYRSNISKYAGVDENGKFWNGNGDKIGSGRRPFSLYLNGTSGKENAEDGNYYYEYTKSYLDSENTDLDVYLNLLPEENKTWVKNNFLIRNIDVKEFLPEDTNIPFNSENLLKNMGLSTELFDKIIADLGIYTNNTKQEKLYKEELNKIYGSEVDGGMLKEYNDNASTNGVPTLNSNYLPIAQTALDITKNLVSYAEVVDETTTEYKKNKIETTVNIYKLKEIQKEVNNIIRVAQTRRAMKMAQDGVENLSPECLAQEEINYISAESGFNTNANSDIIR